MRGGVNAQIPEYVYECPFCRLRVKVITSFVNLAKFVPLISVITGASRQPSF